MDRIYEQNFQHNYFHISERGSDHRFNHKNELTEKFKKGCWIEVRDLGRPKWISQRAKNWPLPSKEGFHNWRNFSSDLHSRVACVATRYVTRCQNCRYI